MSFERVSRARPCPVCKKPDWCRVFADGWVECMRLQSDRPAKSGGWMHRVGDAPSRYIPTPPRIAVADIDATRIYRLWDAHTSQMQLEDLGGRLGLSIMALAGVGAAWSPPHAAWAFPMYDGYEEIVGIRLRANDGRKWAVRGSKQGIFTGHVRAQKTLFVCEGPTDTVAAVELGLFAVGRPNCCCGGPEIKIYARRHGVSRVVIISDNDKPGLDGARKVGSELKLPFAVYVPPAKDVREFVQLGGTRAMIENTLKSTIWQSG